ncbi:MAG: hypothetical protein P1P84_07450 [Deferrisomatales bacterium]|nr:hypothetical protein [Deferrisomatales bacterium]
MGIDYEHKHQEAGLLRMAREIASTLFQSLASEGLAMPDSFFQTLRAAYLRCTQDAIAQYSDLSVIKGLTNDRHSEDILAEAFGRAGEDFRENPLGAPTIPNWNRVDAAMPGIFRRLREAVEKDSQA